MAKKGSKKLESAMREVHRDEPSTVSRAKVSEERKEKMRKAIAYSKARKAGAALPKRTKAQQKAQAKKVISKARSGVKQKKTDRSGGKKRHSIETLGGRA